jgi:hypothetical protein
MPWYCWLFTVVLLVIAYRFVVWQFFFKKRENVESSSLTTFLTNAQGKISLDTPAQGATGIVPGGVSWVPTPQAKGVVKGRGRKGFRAARKKG